MFDNLQIPDEALVKAVDVADKHVGETYDLTINKIAKEAGDGLANIVHIFFGLPHFLNSPFFKEKAKQFINELLDKKKKIPVDRVVEPDYQTVSLALENCRHCITSDELRHMFVNLICNSMDSEYKKQIHPSFSELIKQMSPLDAKILHTFKKQSTQPIGEVQKILSEKEYRVLHSNLFLPDLENEDLTISELSSSITQLSRMGLVSIDFISSVADESAYTEMQINIDMFALEEKCKPEEIRIRRGLVELTPMGYDFLSVCADESV